jgi:3-hydroxybutyrate dehydrogenase
MTASSRRCALVTGSSGGLGYAIAESLAAAGHDIVLHGIDEPEKVEPARIALQTTVTP